MVAFLVTSEFMLVPLALAVPFMPIGIATNCAAGDATDVWFQFVASTITVIFPDVLVFLGDIFSSARDSDSNQVSFSLASRSSASVAR